MKTLVTKKYYGKNLLLNPQFNYIRSSNTDIKLTFNRIINEIRLSETTTRRRNTAENITSINQCQKSGIM